MSWRKLTCRMCRERYRNCECFTAKLSEQRLAEELARAQAAAAELQAKRERALELAMAKVGLA